uniref:growth arrest-specific protein 7-like n=1 Tax=Gasterosteus aculeatus aculeatus TaxID=481459 RepID=UPI001A98209D|nr:growth arrest-specific protein 7-like [Gasterosteus aculeatus aculeatus]
MKPVAVCSAAPEEDSDRRPLPPGWSSYTSPEGLRYYVNSCSKETTWRRPSPSAEAPQRALAPQNAAPYGNAEPPRARAFIFCARSHEAAPTRERKPHPARSCFNTES